MAILNIREDNAFLEWRYRNSQRNSNQPRQCFLLGNEHNNRRRISPTCPRARQCSSLQE